MAAFSFGLRHRIPSRLQQDIHLLTVFRKPGKTDAGCEPRLHTADLERLGHRLKDSPGDDLNIDLSAEAFQKDREFIAPETSHSIDLPHAPLQAACRSLEDEITVLIPKGIIDSLELIEADPHERDVEVIPPPSGERPRGPILKERPVGKVGQAIVLRQIAKPLLCVFPRQSLTDGFPYGMSGVRLLEHGILRTMSDRLQGKKLVLATNKKDDR